MKVNELRLGNWVDLICDGHRDEPDTFQWLLEDYEYYEDNMFNILPITLTEEWLLKFGFKNKEEKWFDISIGREKILGINLFNKKVVIGFGVDLVGTFSHIKHVHQLQNLYFALTNKEL